MTWVRTAPWMLGGAAPSAPLVADHESSRMALRRRRPSDPVPGGRRLDVHSCAIRARQHVDSRLLSERGFTFIELMIVMGIIGMLVAGALIVLQHELGEGKPARETRATLAKLKIHIENLENEDEVYPPGRLPGMPNRLNEGNEAANRSLFRHGRREYPEWVDGETANRDDDRLPRPAHRFGETALTEVVDGFGNPYVYMPARDYVRYADAGVTYTAWDADGELVEVRAHPHRHEDGGFRNPTSFQLFSMGPDGVPNTHDDIGTWTSGSGN